MLKEFAILNNFELEHIKSDSRSGYGQVSVEKLHVVCARLCKEGYPKFQDLKVLQ